MWNNIFDGELHMQIDRQGWKIPLIIKMDKSDFTEISWKITAKIMRKYAKLSYKRFNVSYQSFRFARKLSDWKHENKCTWFQVQYWIKKCESLTRIISSKNSKISVAFVYEFKIGENVIVYEFEAKGAKVIAKDSRPVWNAYLHKS